MERVSWIVEGRLSEEFLVTSPDEPGAVTADDVEKLDFVLDRIGSSPKDWYTHWMLAVATGHVLQAFRDWRAVRPHRAAHADIVAADRVRHAPAPIPQQIASLLANDALPERAAHQLAWRAGGGDEEAQGELADLWQSVDPEAVAEWEEEEDMTWEEAAAGPEGRTAMREAQQAPRTTREVPTVVTVDAPVKPVHRPGPVSLALRPFGYLLIGTVWLAIGLVCSALYWLPLATMAVATALIDEPATLAPLFDNHATGSWIAASFVLVPALLLCWVALVWYLPCATFPLAALSFVYVRRALTPSFARERLSFSVLAPAGQSLGPPTLGGVSLSLQPVHRTRYTDLLMKLYISGWQIDLKAGLVAIPAALAPLLGALAFMEDIPDVVRVLCAVLAAGGWVWSVVGLRRRLQARFADVS